MSAKCIYCGKASEGDYCSQVCEQEYYAYLGRMERFYILQIAGIIVALALFILPVIVGHFAIFAGIALLVLGADLAVMPFAPIAVVNKVGSKRVESVLKITGYVMAGVGAAVLFIMALV